MKTYKGTTYWPTWHDALNYATAHNLPTGRLIANSLAIVVDKCTDTIPINAAREQGNTFFKGLLGALIFWVLYTGAKRL